MEASPQPERALTAADVLRNRIPGAGHLVHMPSHIDIRIGAYDNAIIANQRAILADTAWQSQPGFYAFYRAHNYHFLAYAAMFEGRKALALQAGRDMVARIPIEVVRAYMDFLDGFMAVPYHVMVRFGMWEEILEEPPPPGDLLATWAFRRYARTVALASLGRVEEAGREMDSLLTAVLAVPESRYAGNNSVRTVLGVGVPMAEGELEYRRGNHEKAFALLRVAVGRDDALRYDEPWGWMMPVRHSLGALLLEQGRLGEAEDVYRADLRLHPENGWALHGLAEALRRSAKFREADSMDNRFRESWKRADIAINASCFCRR
jgi:tetratricopeptide (TPR) repeat protein